MCGIVGFTGSLPAAEILCEGLKKLEYRGYDSVGVALLEKSGFNVIKTTKRVEKLNSVLRENKNQSKIGIGHTRWATHGVAIKQNAHPHLSENGIFAVVHNGIIENFSELKKELLADGFSFKSETDTEVIPLLLEKYYKGDLKTAVFKTAERLKGSFALGILCSDYPDTLVAMRNFSPLIIGLGDNKNMISSDIIALNGYTKKAVYLSDGQLAFLTPHNITLFDKTGKQITPHITEIKTTCSQAEKGIYDHFMMKEIKEQPKVLKEIINRYIKNRNPLFKNLNPDKFKKIKSINILACGSAYNAGVAAKYFLESILKIPISAEIASEYRYRFSSSDESTLTIAISQSGETADTIAAADKAKKEGSQTLAIVNVKDSSLSKLCQNVIYTYAGPEISVATTKGYTSQLAILYIFGIWLAGLLNSADSDIIDKLLEEICGLPAIFEEALCKEKEIKKAAKILKTSKSAFFIGRNMDFAAALEGALKLKEISYIHSEAYPAGELKHGSISLIEKDTPIIALCGYLGLNDKMQNNINEAAARGGYIIAFSPEQSTSADMLIRIPTVHPLFSTFSEIIPLQLLAYYTAFYKGCDIDKPRNLAKSVTVE